MPQIGEVDRLAEALEGVRRATADGLAQWRYHRRLVARQLADAYGVTDTDGSRPDCWGYLAAYGWERDDGHGIDEFR